MAFCTNRATSCIRVRIFNFITSPYSDALKAYSDRFAKNLIILFKNKPCSDKKQSRKNSYKSIKIFFQIRFHIIWSSCCIAAENIRGSALKIRINYLFPLVITPATDVRLINDLTFVINKDSNGNVSGIHIFIKIAGIKKHLISETEFV